LTLIEVYNIGFLMFVPIYQYRVCYFNFYPD